MTLHITDLSVHRMYFCVCVCVCCSNPIQWHFVCCKKKERFSRVHCAHSKCFETKLKIIISAFIHIGCRSSRLMSISFWLTIFPVFKATFLFVNAVVLARCLVHILWLAFLLIILWCCLLPSNAVTSHSFMFFSGCNRFNQMAEHLYFVNTNGTYLRIERTVQ